MFLNIISVMSVGVLGALFFSQFIETPWISSPYVPKGKQRS